MTTPSTETDEKFACWCTSACDYKTDIEFTVCLACRKWGHAAMPPLPFSMYEPEPVFYRTKTGRLLTEADIEELVLEAEKGYDLKPVTNTPALDAIATAATKWWGEKRATESEAQRILRALAESPEVRAGWESAVRDTQCTHEPPKQYPRNGAIMGCGCWTYNGVGPGQSAGQDADCPRHGSTRFTKMNVDEVNWSPTPYVAPPCNHPECVVEGLFLSLKKELSL